MGRLQTIIPFGPLSSPPYITNNQTRTGVMKPKSKKSWKNGFGLLPYSFFVVTVKV